MTTVKEETKNWYSKKYSFITGDWPTTETSSESSSDGSYENENKVRFKNVMTIKENRFIYGGIILNVIIGVTVIAIILNPSNLPKPDGTVQKILAYIAVPLLFITESVRLLQTCCIFYFASKARDPEPLEPQPGHRCAFLTTIVPSKEPVEIAIKTLVAAQKIKYAVEYDGKLDVWLLDEGNVPEIKQLCEENGIKHFSRKGIEKYNQETGLFKKKTKHGNHNSWRAEHVDKYDFVAVVDPDHVPNEHFLERMLGYFNDPDVSFVVSPQKYGNCTESWITLASAWQSYIFHGIIQRGANGVNGAFLEGTNHIYRAEAFNQIGGYQDSICEDFLTCLTLFGTENPLTGKHWKAIYTPDIVAVGEGPSSLSDHFSQQQRWAYGCWDIILKHNWKHIPNLDTLEHKIFFIALQFFYPSIAAQWLSSIGCTLIVMFSSLEFTSSIFWWAPFWTASICGGIFYVLWMQRFNLVPEETRKGVICGMALCLMTLPLYVSAAIRNVLGLKLGFVVTAKGDLMTQDTLMTFYEHMKWSTLLGGALALNLCGFGSDVLVHRCWLMFPLFVSLLPIVVHFYVKFFCGGSNNFGAFANNNDVLSEGGTDIEVDYSVGDASERESLASDTNFSYNSITV